MQGALSRYVNEGLGIAFDPRRGQGAPINKIPPNSIHNSD